MNRESSRPRLLRHAGALLTLVAELGFAGSDGPMPLTAFGNSPVYGTYIPVLPGRAYRVLVNIRGPRLARTLEAQFQYRHHH